MNKYFQLYETGKEVYSRYYNCYTPMGKKLRYYNCYTPMGKKLMWRFSNIDHSLSKEMDVSLHNVAIYTMFPYGNSNMRPGYSQELESIYALNLINWGYYYD